MRTRYPFCNNQKQTLDRFVDFPTPLTPTNVIVYGVISSVLSVDWRLRCISNRMSVDVLGVRTRVRDAEMAFWTSVLIPGS